jgi:YaeC family lipoprotein
MVEPHRINMNFNLLLALILGLLSTASGAVTTVRIGVAGGPQAEILTLVQTLANADPRIRIELVPFPRPAQINPALNHGQIDVASFEDGVAQAESIAQLGYELTTAAQTVTLPLGLYSHRTHQLSKLARRALVVVPQDRHDQARALLLLYNYGLIGLRDQARTQARLRDITTNRRELRFKAVPRDQLARSLTTADLVAIDFDTAARLGLTPARDGLGMDDARSPYAGVLTVRTADKNAPWLTELLRVYRSDTVKKFILTQYQDSVRRPW